MKQLPLLACRAHALNISERYGNKKQTSPRTIAPHPIGPKFFATVFEFRRVALLSHACWWRPRAIYFASGFGASDPCAQRSAGKLANNVLVQCSSEGDIGDFFLHVFARISDASRTACLKCIVRVAVSTSHFSLRLCICFGTLLVERPGWLLQIVFHIESRHGERKPYAICVFKCVDHENVVIANKNAGRWLRLCCYRYSSGVFSTNTTPCNGGQSVIHNYDVIGE